MSSVLIDWIQEKGNGMTGTRKLESGMVLQRTWRPKRRPEYLETVLLIQLESFLDERGVSLWWKTLRISPNITACEYMLDSWLLDEETWIQLTES
jgi:hypothetical protein